MSLELSPEGLSDYQRLRQQREDDLQRMLADWNPGEHPEVKAMLHRLANTFASSPPVRPHRA